MLDLTRAKKVLTDENERLRAEIAELRKPITAKEKLIASNEMAVEHMTALEQKSKKEETTK